MDQWVRIRGKIHGMRLRNRVIPQAGTGALRDGESRPGPSGSGCPSYSGEGNESHQAAQSVTVAESFNHLSPGSSAKSSLFPSAPSSPQSYLDLRSTRSSISSCSLSSARTGDVVQEAAIAENIAPTRGTRRTRKTWTKEMNTFIMRQYFVITELESKKKAYLTQLHSLFTSKYPEMEASKQRIGDQRRAILNCNLSIQELTQIREEVKNIIMNPQSNIETNTVTQITQSQKRLSWSDELNEYILKSYYRLTQLETNRTSYRKPLHEAFINKFPALAHLTEQRISDQLRAIINNKYITDERLNTLREEVADELIVTNIDRLSTNTSEIQYTNTVES